MRTSRTVAVLAAILAILIVCPLTRGQTHVGPVTDMDARDVTVVVDVFSPQNGLSVLPGEQIDWMITARVKKIGNKGLAMIAVDLMQHPDNPQFFDLPRADETPLGMEGFDRPRGFTNPDREDPWGSGYGGTPIGRKGTRNLKQIGGAQNTLGARPRWLGPRNDIHIGQDYVVDAGVGHQPGGQIIAKGSFPAPILEGTYLFCLESAVANVLTEIKAPPFESYVEPAPVALRKGDFGFHVDGDRSLPSGPKRGDSAGRDATWPRWTNVILPPDGAVMNRTHLQFRWPPFEDQPAEYTLWIAEQTDGDSGDGTRQFLFFETDGSEPRTVVTSGLEFGKSYKWCVTDGTVPSGDETIRYFSTEEIPATFPEIIITRPPGGGPLEPGLTLFNLFEYQNDIVVVDELGKVVYFMNTPGTSVGDIDLLPNGLYRFIGNKLREITLDGAVLWASPDGYFLHHDSSPMPSGNLMTLHDDYQLFGGQLYIGNTIIEFDRHTREEVWTWSTFNHYSLEIGGPLPDYVHGNDAFYHEPDGCVYFSSRHFARISRIDYKTGSIVYNMGYEWPDGSTHFGHNLFTYQHAPEVLPNGNMMVYDNGNYRLPMSDPRQTKAIELAFDDPLNPTSADIVWEYALTHDDGSEMFCSFWGDADRLPGGNTLITGGDYVTIFEVDANADLVWKLRLEGGSFGKGDSSGDGARGIYRAERITELIVDSPCDSDGDWDIDLVDFAEFQIGSTVPEPVEFPYTLSDFDRDGDIDKEDIHSFVFWMTGPG